MAVPGPGGRKDWHTEDMRKTGEGGRVENKDAHKV